MEGPVLVPHLENRFNLQTLLASVQVALRREPFVPYRGNGGPLLSASAQIRPLLPTTMKFLPNLFLIS